MNKPIMQFKDDKELRDTMLWWKDKLYLGDWIIKVKLEDKVIVDDSECEGRCDSVISLKCAFIEVSSQYRNYTDNIITDCEEQVLVHELLHCKYPNLTDDSYSSKVQELLEHQKLDFMSRTLIELKYNLDKSFWDNSIEEVQSEKIHPSK